MNNMTTYSKSHLNFPKEQGEYSIQKDFINSGLTKINDSRMTSLAIQTVSNQVDTLVKEAAAGAKKGQFGLNYDVNCNAKFFPIVARALYQLHGIRVKEVNNVQNPNAALIKWRRDNQSVNPAFAYFQADRKQQRFTDFEFKIKGQNLSFPCHKAALASKSQFFESGLSNLHSKKDTFFEFDKGVSGAVVEFLLDYIYDEKKEIPVTFSAIEANQLLKIAKTFKLKTLERSCLHLLIREFKNAGNHKAAALEFLLLSIPLEKVQKYADDLALPELEEECIRYKLKSVIDAPLAETVKFLREFSTGGIKISHNTPPKVVAELHHIAEKFEMEALSHECQKSMLLSLSGNLLGSVQFVTQFLKKMPTDLATLSSKAVAQVLKFAGVYGFNQLQEDCIHHLVLKLKEDPSIVPEAIEIFKNYSLNGLQELGQSSSKAIGLSLRFAKEIGDEAFGKPLLEEMRKRIKLPENLIVPFIRFVTTEGKILSQRVDSKQLGLLFKYAHEFGYKEATEMAIKKIVAKIEATDLHMKAQTLPEILQFIDQYLHQEIVEVPGDLSSMALGRLLKYARDFSFEKLHENCLQRLTQKLIVDVAHEIKKFMNAKGEILDEGELQRICEIVSNTGGEPLKAIIPHFGNLFSGYAFNLEKIQKASHFYKNVMIASFSTYIQKFKYDLQQKCSLLHDFSSCCDKTNLISVK